LRGVDHDPAPPSAAAGVGGGGGARCHGSRVRGNFHPPMCCALLRFGGLRPGASV
jgi:hypothetical protein